MTVTAAIPGVTSTGVGTTGVATMGAAPTLAAYVVNRGEYRGAHQGEYQDGGGNADNTRTRELEGGCDAARDVACMDVEMVASSHVGFDDHLWNSHTRTCPS